jgi:hypothetical protein
VVTAELQARTAEQLFQVLGQLKGGAMKLGQALSVFEAALPEDLAAPYRAALTKLQEAAPPLPVATVHAVLALELGPRWREQFSSFDDRPAAAASIGQVHRAVWADGREVAVKIQYPGAGPALLADLKQLGRLARLFSVFIPGLDIKPLLTELEERVTEELDYRLEAEAQETFAAAYDGDQEIRIPEVVTGTERVLVTEWMEGSRSRTRSPTGRRRSATAPPCCSPASCCPDRCWPGCCTPIRIPATSACCPTGASASSTSGPSTACPTGHPSRSAAGPAGAGARGRRGARRPAQRGLRRGSIEVDADEAAVLPAAAARAVDGRRSASAARGCASRPIGSGDPRSPRPPSSAQLNLPPSYLLIHRVTKGRSVVLCQLGGTAAYRASRALAAGFATPTPRPDLVRPVRGR